MTGLDATQAPQESEYCFPYHYVARMPEAGFAQHFVDTWGINYISTVEYLLAQIEKIPLGSLIDIGCGDGRLTREIKSRFPPADVVGIDYSNRAINLARAMNQGVPGLRYEQVDLAKVQMKGDFDAAVLMEVYEHIPTHSAASFLEGVRAVLKKGGVLLVTVPHANKPVEYKHYRHFTCDALSRELSVHFDVVEVVPFEKRSAMRTALNGILCNRLFVLNQARTIRGIYRLYRKYLFDCERESECQRIFVKAIAR